MVFFQHFIFFVCYSASRAQPQITLIILSPFFRCTRHLSLWQIRRLSRAVQLARWCSKFGEKTVFNLEIKLQANEKKSSSKVYGFFMDQRFNWLKMWEKHPFIFSAKLYRLIKQGDISRAEKTSSSIRKLVAIYASLLLLKMLDVLHNVYWNSIFFGWEKRTLRYLFLFIFERADGGWKEQLCGR